MHPGGHVERARGREHARRRACAPPPLTAWPAAQKLPQQAAAAAPAPAPTPAPAPARAWRARRRPSSTPPCLLVRCATTPLVATSRHRAAIYMRLIKRYELAAHQLSTPNHPACLAVPTRPPPLQSPGSSRQQHGGASGTPDPGARASWWRRLGGGRVARRIALRTRSPRGTCCCAQVPWHAPGLAAALAAAAARRAWLPGGRRGKCTAQLFGLPALSQPADFPAMAQASMHRWGGGAQPLLRPAVSAAHTPPPPPPAPSPRCKGLVQQILAAPGDASVVQLMDDMSDEVRACAHTCMACARPHPALLLLLQLCRTYDAAEACRNIHQDRAWRQAATQACRDLGGQPAAWGVGLLHFKYRSSACARS